MADHPSAPDPQDVAERIAAAGGRARFAGRVALGVYGDSEVPSWSVAAAGAARGQVNAIGLLAIPTSAPLVCLLLLLPALALRNGTTILTMGLAVLLPTLAAALVVVPAASIGARPSRGSVVAWAAVATAAAGVVCGLLLTPWPIVALVAVGSMLALITSATARPLVSDSVVPEARARALSRWATGWAFGATLGAVAAGLSSWGPAVGPVAAVAGVSAVALLLGLAGFSLKEPGIGGAETARLRVLFGESVAHGLSARTSGAAALGRVVRSPAALTTLTGFVSVGLGAVGILAPAHLAILGSGTAVAPGVPALAVAAGLLVATVLLPWLGYDTERHRRWSPDRGARRAVLGLGLVAAGALVLAFAPTAPIVAAGVALSVVGALLAAVALDSVLFTVVAPGDRAAAAALSALSMVAGGVLAYLLISLLTQVSSLRVGLGAAAVAAAAAALATLRTTRLATAGLDELVGADADDLPAEPLADDGVVPVLEARAVNYSYGSVQALYGVNLSVRPGELVALLGPNGVGKTTLLRVLSGLAGPSTGTVRVEGEDVTRTNAAQRVALGLSQITGGHAVFGSMTVEENLRVYGYSLGKDRRAVDAGIQQSYEAFSRLSDRRSQLASTLSGGEQQMLGLAKALMLKPKILLIDEFSLGLAPVIVGELMATVRTLNAEGTAVLLVEQSVNVALSLVERVYFMEKGRITYRGSAQELRSAPDLVAALSMGGAHVEDLGVDDSAPAGASS